MKQSLENSAVIAILFGAFGYFVVILVIIGQI